MVMMVVVLFMIVVVNIYNSQAGQDILFVD